MATAKPSSHETGGYPRELFKNGVSLENYLCSECGLILREPVQALCEHKFCRLCLEAKLSVEGPIQCPQCEKDDADKDKGYEDFSIIEQDKIFPDNATKHEMAKFDVMCQNAGCGWRGKFEKYETHASECQFKKVQCENCGKMVRQNFLEKHLADHCKIHCTGCYRRVLARHMQEHKDNDCPKAMEICPDCGAAGILRENLSSHRQSSECHSEPVACPAHCGLIQLKDYQSHFKQMRHEVWVVNALQLTSQRLERLESESVSESQQSQITQRLTQATEKTTWLGQRVSEITQILNATSMSERPPGIQSSEFKVRQAVELQAQAVNERVDVQAGTFEGINNELKRELSNLERQRQTQTGQLQERLRKLQELERELSTVNLRIDELEMKINLLEAADDDGTIIWRVKDFSKKLQDAQNGNRLSIYSSPFYTTTTGYKMCGRLYPNGDGMGKGSHASVFFVIMRGNFDPLLKWPFEQKVYFCLINQAGGEHIIDSFRPDPRSSSFQRPTSDMNIASGCPLFVRHDVLLNPKTGFLKDDTLFIKIAVDVKGLASYMSVPGDKV